jgi:hypothetical protein
LLGPQGNYSPSVRDQGYDDRLGDSGEDTKEAEERITRVLQGKTPKRLQHDVRMRASAATAAAIKNIEFQVVRHPRYNPDLAPSDFRLFAARRIRVTCDEVV